MINGNLIEQTLSSMEVAEMVEKEHHKLMRDIRRYTKQFDESNFGCIDITGAKISPADFWIESNYVDKNNRKKPCYQITKLGCEFIAHKTTGTKGTAFTAKYIVRFHQMEEALKEVIAEKSSPELPDDERKCLAKYNKTWYETQKWKMDRLCYDYGWERKYLYHKILREISDIWSIDWMRERYYNRNGKEPDYDMDLINDTTMVQGLATRYLDFLLDAHIQ